MTSIKLLAAAVILSAAAATPVFAQAAIQEPGAYAFYHPNADPGARPAADAMASLPHRDNGNMARLRMQMMSRGVVVRHSHSVKAY